VAEITIGDVMDVLQPIWKARPEMASRVGGRIESVIDFATARSWRTGENPARWKGHLENLLPARSKLAAVEHHAALAYLRDAHILLADGIRRLLRGQVRPNFHTSKENNKKHQSDSCPNPF
jgi:hypothetical protein